MVYGLYVLPDVLDLYIWHGLLIVREGRYAGGAFRFVICAHPLYPADGARPLIVFLDKPYHPLVDPLTGALQLEARFSTWRVGPDRLPPAIEFVREMLTSDTIQLPPSNAAYNKEAWRLFNAQPDEFERRAARSAEDAASRAVRHGGGPLPARGVGGFVFPSAPSAAAAAAAAGAGAGTAAGSAAVYARDYLSQAGRGGASASSGATASGSSGGSSSSAGSTFSSSLPPTVFSSGDEAGVGTGFGVVASVEYVAAGAERFQWERSPYSASVNLLKSAGVLSVDGQRVATLAAAIGRARGFRLREPTPAHEALRDEIESGKYSGGELLSLLRSGTPAHYEDARADAADRIARATAAAEQKAASLVSPRTADVEAGAAAASARAAAADTSAAGGSAAVAGSPDSDAAAAADGHPAVPDTPSEAATAAAAAPAPADACATDAEQAEAGGHDDDESSAVREDQAAIDGDTAGTGAP